MTTTTPAQFITGLTGQAFDPAQTMPAIESGSLGSQPGSVSDFIARQRALPIYADVPMRAEFRVWGSYPKASALVTGATRERYARPAGRTVMIGVGYPSSKGGRIASRMADLPWT